MQPNFEEYKDMVHELSEGGFSADQSEALVILLARLFAQQNEFYERIRDEDKADRERIRKEDVADRERIRQEDKQWREDFQEEYRERQTKLEASMTKFEDSMARITHWVITTLTTLLLSTLGALIIYALSVME